MFPSSHGSMKTLLEGLKLRGMLTSQRVYNAMLSVDRADFTNSYPYEDLPQYIDFNATISAPHMHAYALEYLKDHITEGCHVLDVGSGSGYLTVAFSKLMNDTGKVVGIEHIKGLYDIGYKNIMKHYSTLVDSGVIILECGDGRKGFKPQAPYKAIHVGAAAPEIPQDLVDQLDKGGRMVLPVGTSYQCMCIVDKDVNGEVTIKKDIGVNYVPLTSAEQQLKGRLG